MSRKTYLKASRPIIKYGYTVNSTMSCNLKFKNIISEFTNCFEVISFDATSLFNLVNVPRVVGFIISKSYMRIS